MQQYSPASKLQTAKMGNRIRISSSRTVKNENQYKLSTNLQSVFSYTERTSAIYGLHNDTSLPGMMTARTYAN